jgi:DNA-binding protein HU-beta
MEKAATAPVVIVNKDAIVTSMAAKTGLRKADAERAYTALLETIREGLVRGMDVRLSGVGSLRTKMSKEKQARNPRTGEVLPGVIAARREVRFSTSKELKEAVAAPQAD